MPNPLDPIWSAHQTVRHTMKVVRRCTSVPDVNRPRAFANTLFRARPDADCSTLLDAAEQQADEGAVVALYARFEAHLRDHLVEQTVLSAAANRPDAAFGTALAQLIAGALERVKMDDVASLFEHAVGQARIADIGTIRVYRHWLAHGKGWAPPPIVTPTFAVAALTGFLTASGLL